MCHRFCPVTKFERIDLKSTLCLIPGQVSDDLFLSPIRDILHLLQKAVMCEHPYVNI